MIKNNLLLKVLNRETVDRPPIWLLGQAGKVTPGYKKIKSEAGSYASLLKNPELSSELAYRAAETFDVDAAVLPVNLLNITEGMGLSYSFDKNDSLIMEDVIDSSDDIDKLTAGSAAAAEMDYIYSAVERTVEKLGGEIPFIGFSGAPWTILAYMIEGKDSHTFSKARRFLYTNPVQSHRLLDKITTTIISFLKSQIDAGADVLHIYDSEASMIGKSLYQTFSIPYLKRICLEIKAPTVVFSKGAYYVMNDIKDLSSEAIGVDLSMNINEIRNQVGPNKVLQGNLDPCILFAEPGIIEKQVHLSIRRAEKNQIFNLGSDILDDTPMVGIRTFVQSVKSHMY